MFTYRVLYTVGSLLMGRVRCVKALRRLWDKERAQRRSLRRWGDGRRDRREWIGVGIQLVATVVIPSFPIKVIPRDSGEGGGDCGGENLRRCRRRHRLLLLPRKYVP